MVAEAIALLCIGREEKENIRLKWHIHSSHPGGVATMRWVWLCCSAIGHTKRVKLDLYCLKYDLPYMVCYIVLFKTLSN